jgi:hypothetical protein
MRSREMDVKYINRPLVDSFAGKLSASERPEVLGVVVHLR